MTSIRSLLRRLLFAAAIAVPAFTLAVPQAHAGIFISVGFAPPALPIYVQPALPAPGYIWTPGYWAYGDAGYYWVPGVWVQPPSVGLLWTPGYWGFAGGFYGWHGGYWGPHVGFYGGVNYGFGYGGVGFFGGEWRGGAFAYNRAVANFGGVHVTNVYEDRTVVERNTIVNNNHVSFNGGNGGIQAHASAGELQAEHENHIQPTANQTQHQTLASQDRGQLASVNHGRPATMAASNTNQYHQTAQQHIQSQPISSADRAAGSRNTNTAANRPGNQPARTTTPARTAQTPARGAENVNHGASNVNRTSSTVNRTASRTPAANNTANKAPANKAPSTASRPSSNSRPAPRESAPKGGSKPRGR